MRIRTIATTVFAIAGTLAGGASFAQQKLSGWETLTSERYGFLLAYPGSVFAVQDDAEQEAGHVLVSRDGKAKLLVGTFENDEQTSLEEYRAHLLTENYVGANVDYAPVKKKWFVISGTREGMHFYERVSFTCGGRLINSWALLYPAGERRFYDRVVEAIARTYTPGAGRTGDCD
jgi:hypothetical protein